MKTTMSVKEAMEILKIRAIAYLEGLDQNEKIKLANDYRKRSKRTNFIFIVVLSLLVAACLTLANMLPLVFGYDVNLVISVPIALVGIGFLALIIYLRVQMSSIDKMPDDAAMLNGAIKHIQKNTTYEELRIMMTSGIGEDGAGVPDNTEAAAPSNTIDTTSDAYINEGVSGKEENSEGHKQEGELVRQRLSIEGKSTAEILTELKSLYEEGLITEADYEKKKEEILEKM